MNNLLPLMRREWLQHRFAWALLLLVPLALAVLPLTFGDVQLDNEVGARTGPELALMVATISIVATTTILFLILWISSVFVAVGTPRRDHADRSIEFWLSLPTGHTVSLVAPMLVHLLLVPAAALAAGWLAGVLVSLVDLFGTPVPPKQAADHLAGLDPGEVVAGAGGFIEYRDEQPAVLADLIEKEGDWIDQQTGGPEVRKELVRRLREMAKFDPRHARLQSAYFQAIAQHFQALAKAKERKDEKKKPPEPKK